MVNRRVVVGTSNDANGKAILLTKRESPVAAGEGLIVGLLPCPWIPPSVPGVDNCIAVICVVFVAAGEDY